MIVERVVISNVPVLICSQHFSNDRYILAYYGAGMNKELYAKYYFVRKLTKMGYKVIIPELYKHGERIIVDIYQSPKDRFQVVKKAVDEVSYVLDYFLDNQEYCSVVGGSLGGLCAMGAAVKDKRISTICVYNTFISWSAIPGEKRNLLQEELKKYNPRCNLKQLCNRRIQILLGEKDKWAKPDLVCGDVEILKRLSLLHNGEIDFRIIKGNGHTITIPMEKQIVSWISEELNK